MDRRDFVKTALRHILTSGAGMIGTALQFIAGIVISAFLMISVVQMPKLQVVLDHALAPPSPTAQP